MRINFKFPEDFKNESEFVTYANFIRRLVLIHDSIPKVIGFRASGITNIFSNSDEITQDTHTIYQILSDLNFKNLSLDLGKKTIIKIIDGSSGSISNDKVKCLSNESIYRKGTSNFSLEVFIGNFEGFRSIEDNKEFLRNETNVIPISSYHTDKNFNFNYEKDSAFIEITSKSEDVDITSHINNSIQKLSNLLNTKN